jgi:hypothetical protein
MVITLTLGRMLMLLSSVGMLVAEYQVPLIDAPAKPRDSKSQDSSKTPAADDGIAGKPAAKPALDTDPDSNRDVDYTPLTNKERYYYSVEQIFSIPRLAGILARTSIDQASGTPGGWGGGTEGYALRLASHFGRAFVHENIAFAVRALDHEDPRYFVSGHGSTWTRIKYATKATFVVRNDNNKMMPAYSRFVADFTMPFISQAWHPEPIRVGRELGSGSMGLGMGVANNVFLEFWPDLKRKLHR